MQILLPPYWSDYALLDSGNGKRLERFGKFVLVRPDPQCIWKPSQPQSQWHKADATIELSNKSGETGTWKLREKLPQKWPLKYQNLEFWVKLSPFKHTGVFPEEAIWWKFIADELRKSKNPEDRKNILNLFGYTGIASLAAAAAGAKVTHVDASYPTIGWGRENQHLSRLDKLPIRWMLDDALKFCQRELKRSVKYDGMILDPPIYGHGPHGEVWDFYKTIPSLLDTCSKLLSDNPVFVIINAYAVSSSAIMLENLLKDYLKNRVGEFDCGELALQEEKSGRLLSTGIFARWQQ